MGYEPASISISLTNDTILDIYIRSQPIGLNEVVVVADSAKSIEVSRQGNYLITPVAIHETPKFFSEPDLMKSFQFIPGVVPGKDGSSDIYVRGGNAGQNIVVANGCYFFLPGHLLGFISSFDIDFLESAELIKEYFPAELGGGSSSVIELDYKKVSSDSLKFQVTAGLLSSGITTEIPLSKIGSGITAGFRLGNYRVYSSLLRRVAGDDIGRYLPSKKYSFFDGYLKFDHTSEKAGELSYLFLENYDNAPQTTNNPSPDTSAVSVFSDGVRTGWKNMVHSLQWTPPAKRNLGLRIDLNYNRISTVREMYELSEDYDDGILIGKDKYTNAFSPSINNFGLTIALNGMAGNVRLSGGFSNRLRFFSPNVTATYEGTDTLFKNEISGRYIINEPALFVSSMISFKNKLNIEAGFRISGGIIKGAMFIVPEPRLRFVLNPEGIISPHINYVRISQFDHNIEGTNTGLRSMLWIPVSKKLGPEKSNIFSAGAQVHPGNNYVITLDIFFKKTTGMADFKPGASFIFDESFDDLLDKTEGKAYGIETGFIKRKGKLTGTVTYTYSRSKREWDAPDGIIWIPTNADRPHNFNISMKYNCGPKTGFGLNWVYISGTPATIYMHSTGWEQWFDTKNNIRYLDYHRLDLSFRKIIPRKEFTVLIDVDINNVYNRKNTFFLQERYDPDGHRYFKNISLFPVMPSFALTVKF